METDLEWVQAHTRRLLQAREWERRGRDRSLLLRGSDLSAAERWLSSGAGKEPAPTADHIAYLQASRGAAIRRQRLGMGVVSAALAGAVVLSVFSLVQRGRAIEGQHLAQSRELSARATENLVTDPESSVLLASRALDIKHTTEAEETLRQALLSSHIRATLHPAAAAAAAAFSPDGRFVMTQGQRDGDVRIWRRDDWMAVATIPGKQANPGGARFSPSGSRLLTLSREGVAAIWDPATGRRVRALAGGRAPLRSAVWSADGRRVALGGADGTVAVRDARSGRLVVGLRAARTPIVALALAPGGGRIAAAETGADNETVVRVRELASGRVAATLRAGAVGGFIGGIDVAFSPDGARILTQGSVPAMLWDAASGRRIADLGQTASADVAAFDPTGAYLAAGGIDGVAVMDARSGEVLARFRGHEGVVTSVAFSPDGRKVASTSVDGTVRVWRTADAAPIAVFRGHVGGVGGASFSADGRAVASIGNQDGTARVWGSGEIDSLRDSQDVEAPISAGDAPLTPDGSVRALLGAGAARLVDAESGAVLHELSVQEGSVFTSLGFSGDGARAALAGDDRVAVFSTRDGRPVGPVIDADLGNYVRSVALDSDGGLVAAGGRGGILRIWEPGSGRLMLTLAHDADVASIRFSADGRFLLTGADDGLARVWELSTGKLLIHLPGAPRDWSTDGRRIVTEDGALTRLWPCDVCQGPDGLRALAAQRTTRDFTAGERARYLHE
jgi:WD40 repeat protein